jgi:cell division protein FtsZ
MLTEEPAKQVTNLFFEAIGDTRQETEPVLKTGERQPDLFGSFFSEAPAEEPASQEVVVHPLTETVAEESPEAEFPEVELKIADEQFQFPPDFVPAAEPVAEVEEEPAPNPDEGKTDESIEEQLRRSKERILRLKDLSIKLRSTNGLQELENEPAYKRKQMSLQDIPHSSESQVSRFTLSADDEGITEIRSNNSYLHDNVD